VKRSATSVFVSRYEHCLLDPLWRHRAGELRNALSESQGVAPRILTAKGGHAVVEPAQVEKVFPHSIYVPYDPGAGWYETEGWNGGGDAEAWEYTGWRDETMSWKTTCSIHGHLNPTPTFVLRGRGALKLLSDTCVNSFAKFSVGGAKHAVMCNQAGQIMVHGMVLRLGEEEFVTYWLAPWLPYLLQKDAAKYDVVVSDVRMPSMSGPRFVEQLRQTEPDVKVLFLTGYSKQLLAEHGELWIDEALLEKPCTAQELLDCVSKLAFA
jgi:CheY-like chemotaxis protein